MPGLPGEVLARWEAVPGRGGWYVVPGRIGWPEAAFENLVDAGAVRLDVAEAAEAT